MVVGAPEVLRIGAHCAFVDEVDVDPTLREGQARLHGVGQPLPDAIADDDAVDDHGDRVLVLLLQLRRVVQADLLPVDHRPRVPLGQELREEVLELALPVADERCEHHQLGALGQFEEAVDDLLGALLLDHLPAGRAVRDADARPEETEEVMDLRDRADGRARILRCRLLIDRDRRGQPLDEVDVRLVDLPQELPRVGGQGFDVPALALREDRVERQGRLAGTAQPGEHHHRVARDGDRRVLEVVGTSALDADDRGIVVEGRRVRRGHGGLLHGVLRSHAPTLVTGTDTLTPL